MPQLNAAKAAEVEKAEGGNFEPIPEGLYVLVLAKEVEVKEGENGPYWNWTFKVAPDVSEEQDPYKGRQIWQNTSLSENAMWRLKETFAAFGVPTSTHTDELIGKQVKAFIVQRTIDKGARKGQLTNEIKNLYALNESTEDGPSRPAGSGAASQAVPLY